MPEPSEPVGMALMAFPMILTMDVMRYVLAASILSGIIFVARPRWVWRRKIQRRSATRSDMAREIRYSLMTAGIFACTGAGVFLGARTGIFTIYEDFSLRGGWYMAASFVALLVAHDAYFYWTHRLMHYPRLFRVFHRTHHKSRTPTPWAAYAFDWPEAFVQAAILPLFLLAVPLHGVSILLFTLHMIVRNVVGHAGFELFPAGWTERRWLDWVSTTTHHDIHHETAGFNYGLYFTWWDRLMGTEHPDYKARFRRAAGDAQKEGRAGAMARAGAFLLIGGGVAAVLLGTWPAKAEMPGDDHFSGRWASQNFGAVIEIARCTPGDPRSAYCGTIRWLFDALDEKGRPKSDTRHPDPERRGRPLIGMRILDGFKESKPGVLTGGHIYNPEDGRTYQATIKSVGPEALTLEGCAFGIFCRSQTWRRASGLCAALRPPGSAARDDPPISRMRSRPDELPAPVSGGAG